MHGMSLPESLSQELYRPTRKRALTIVPGSLTQAALIAHWLIGAMFFVYSYVY